MTQTLNDGINPGGEPGMIDWRAVSKIIREPATPRHQQPPSRATWEAQRLDLYRRKLALEMEAIRLYEPIPLGDALHRSMAMWTVADGSNRAGKTVSCAAEAAYALLGCHPHGKYVRHNGKAWFVGLTEHHLILMYDALFRPGAFRVIRDEHTKLWRTMRWDRNNPGHLQPYDEAYKEQSREAPPFIPLRAAETSWRDKKTGIPNVTKFHNGWTIVWTPGGGIPEQGQHWNFWWFDEEMANPEVYKEALRGGARLAHETFLTMPRGIWSATSQIANPELAELREKAGNDPDSKFAKRITYLMRDNPYLHADTEATLREGYSEADIATRVEGIPAAQYRRIYPSYDPMGPHGVEPEKVLPLKDDWCVWAVTDPGRRRCATIFDGIDPEHAFHTVYGGFQLPPGADAHAWAAEMKAHQLKIGRRYHGIIMDQARGRQTLDSLYSKTVAEQYWQALTEAGVVPATRGNVKGMAGFWPGLNNVDARERALLNMLAVRSDGPFAGTSQFRVVRGALPELDKQIRNAHTDPKHPQKRYEHNNVPDDWVDDAEYLAAFDPGYGPPQKAVEAKTSSVYENLKAKRRKAQLKQSARARLQMY